MDLDIYTCQLLSAALFEGSITREQERELLTWLKQDKAHYDLFVSWKDAWLADNHTNERIETLWQNFQLLIDEPLQQVMPLWRRPMVRWAVACCAMLLIVLSLHIALRPSVVNDTPVLCQTSTYSAMGEQPSAVMLPDGSQVFLNIGSQLTWTDHRHVSLSGEAWFEVESDTEHPFVVETKQMTITVTGTQFNVSAYAEDPSEVVSLFQGRVQVSGGDQQVLLQPNQQVSLTKDGTMQVEACQAERAGLWREGKMDYTAISMDELLVRLSRMYHTPIELNEQRNWPSIRFVMYEPHKLQDILLGLQDVHGIHVEKTAEGYRID